MSKPRMAWRKASVRLADADGNTLITAEGFITRAAPGLAVTHNTDANVWSITHIKSGYALGPRCYSAATAQKVLLAYAPLADWTRGQAELWADLGLCRSAYTLREALEAVGDYPQVPRNPPTEMPEPARALLRELSNASA